MILSVPYIYQAQVVREKKRASEFVNYSGVVPVDFIEIDGNEAPVALRYDGREYETRNLLHPMDLIELRWREGRLYKPQLIFDGEVWNNELATFKRALESKNIRGLPFPFKYKTVLPSPLAEDRGVKTFRSSDEDAAIAEVLSHARDILIIDGQIWSTTLEPLLTVVDRRGRGDDHVPRHVDIKRQGGRDVYRFDESFMIETLHSRDFDTYADDGPPALPFHEVLIPECQRARTTDRAILLASYTLLQEMKERIAEADDAYFMAYREFRDALAPFRSGADRGHRFETVSDDEEDANKDVSFVANFLERAFAAHRTVFSESPEKMNMFTAMEVKRAIKRSELRLARFEDLLDFTP